MGRAAGRLCPHRAPGRAGEQVCTVSPPAPGGPGLAAEFCGLPSSGFHYNDLGWAPPLVCKASVLPTQFGLEVNSPLRCIISPGLR